MIAAGLKDVENRSWRTDFRGRVLVHTSATLWGEERNPIKVLSGKQLVSLYEADMVHEFMRESFRTSAIIGSVDVVDCIQNSESIWAEEGQWHWILRNGRLFKTPVLFIKGRLGIWESKINEEWLIENGFVEHN